ncbi:MAG: iron ABC transporter permease [Calditrichia bacterium]|nr:iron ABC transporter permease [Calditrichia bacterium]
MIRPFRLVISILILFTILSAVLAPLIGTNKSSFLELFSSEIGQQIFFDLRLPRVVFAFLVGFSLAMIGVAFQALLQNELATPYTLGVASGGALGAVIAIKSGLVFTVFGFTNIIFFSVGGSVLTILIIYLIAKSRAGLSPITLILTGVTISLLFSSLILFVHYLADFTETYRMIRWLMGGLQVTGWYYSLVLFPFVSLTFLYLFRKAVALNIISSGDEMALSKGVDVLRLQRGVFLISSVLVGIIVAFAGPIGFIGLIIPHLIRLIVGADHRKLLITAPIFGGTFLIWCDTFSRTIISPAELPVGIITAMLGGPFFIWLLIRQKRSI